MNRELKWKKTERERTASRGPAPLDYSTTRHGLEFKITRREDDETTFILETRYVEPVTGEVLVQVADKYCRSVQSCQLLAQSLVDHVSEIRTAPGYDLDKAVRYAIDYFGKRGPKPLPNKKRGTPQSLNWWKNDAESEPYGYSAAINGFHFRVNLVEDDPKEFEAMWVMSVLRRGSVEPEGIPLIINYYPSAEEAKKEASKIYHNYLKP